MKNFLIAIIIFTFSTTLVFADKPEGTVLNSGEIYQNVQDQGDIFVLVRYTLPAQDPNATEPTNLARTDNDWCFYITDPSGCVTQTSTLPVVPFFPETLKFGALFIRLKDNANNVKAEKEILRITSSLAILKINQGHTITDFTGYKVCIESPQPNIKNINITPNCLNTELSALTDQNIGFGNAILDQVINIEREESLETNTFVENQLITANGQVNILDPAFPNLFDVVPQIFANGVQFDIKTFEEVGTNPSVLDNRYKTESSATQNFNNIEYLSQQYFGLQGTLTITLLFVFISVILGAFIFIKTKEIVLTTIGGFLPLVIGMQFSSPISSYVLGSLLIMLIATAIVFGRRWSN